MNVELEVLVAPFMSALVTGVVVGAASYVAVRMSLVRIQTQQEERAKVQEKRDGDVDAKFAALHAALGMLGTNGGGYVRRGECIALEGNVAAKLGDIKSELHEFRVEVDGRIERLESRVDNMEKEA